MDALDTNILVYLHRSDMVEHKPVRTSFESHLQKGGEFAVAQPVIREFLAVVTNPRLFEDPTPIGIGTDFIANLVYGAQVRIVSETERHLDELKAVAQKANAVGRQIYDAGIATVCLEHGIRTIWTRDRDFRNFRDLKTFNPLKTR